jgi:hypothetical protein
MHKLGFADKWITLVMTCVSIVSYSVLIKENPLEFISLSRGLRQRDHLFPYLFLLFAEGLSSLLIRVIGAGNIT